MQKLKQKIIEEEKEVEKLDRVLTQKISTLQEKITQEIDKNDIRKAITGE